MLLSGAVPQDESAAPALPGTGTGRLVFDPDGADFVEVAIYDRASLMPGAVILGPAVIVEDET